MKTKRDIEYRLPFSGHTFTIPKGTAVIAADNLPQPNAADIAYWCKPWRGMTDTAKAHERTYGFGVSANDVTK